MNIIYVLNVRQISIVVDRNIKVSDVIANIVTCKCYIVNVIYITLISYITIIVNCYVKVVDIIANIVTGKGNISIVVDRNIKVVDIIANIVTGKVYILIIIDNNRLNIRNTVITWFNRIRFTSIVASENSCSFGVVFIDTYILAIVVSSTGSVSCIDSRIRNIPLENLNILNIWYDNILNIRNTVITCFNRIRFTDVVSSIFCFVIKITYKVTSVYLIWYKVSGVYFITDKVSSKNNIVDKVTSKNNVIDKVTLVGFIWYKITGKNNIVDKVTGKNNIVDKVTSKNLCIIYCVFILTKIIRRVFSNICC